MPAMDNAFDSLLQRFLPISLNEMKNVRLMNRSDTKFITDKKTLEKLLRTAAQLYYVQEINGLRISNYQTIYWDTPEHTFYRIHHNGNKPRIKIRTRTYADSNLTFLEIKNKDNHGKTSKKRIAITQPDIRKDQEGQAFIQKQTGYSIQSIHPCLQNRFHRITLVNKAKSERITIDYDVVFYNSENGHSESTGQLVIIEQKRDGRYPSPLKELLLNLRIKPHGFSKYCIGSLLTNPTLKSNLFKSRLREIHKLVNY